MSVCLPNGLFFITARLERWRNHKREEEDDLAFPDELDTPKDVPAKVRFQRFRGMRSFRTSPWDPYENLPRDYARIFQFEDFKRTECGVRRRAEQELGVVEVFFFLLILGYIDPIFTFIAWRPSDALPKRCPSSSGQRIVAHPFLFIPA